MSNPTTPFSWQMPTATDLVTDLPADFEVFGQGVATAMADLLGGPNGYILSKASATDMDFAWIANDQGDITGVTAGIGISGGGTSGAVTVTNSMATAIDAKGDLIGGTGADTFSRLAIGANATVLTADSAEATGMKWAAPAAGGKVLQVVQGTNATPVTSSSATFADTGLTVNITPTLNTSKILVMLNHACKKDSGNASPRMSMRLMRDATNIATIVVQNLFTSTDLRQNSMLAYSFLDSPATTSAITYKTQFANQAAAGDVAVQPNSETCTIIVMEIGA